MLNKKLERIKSGAADVGRDLLVYIVPPNIIIDQVAKMHVTDLVKWPPALLHI